ncbi:MAG TPA: AAA family ATPase [Kofleriaceae bacterium]|nr:AAA family ATPase [Kofleriaceae bacterium]
MLVFPPYRLDLDEERLWKGNKLLSLRRKPFAILRYLATNPRRLVTHDELLRHVWGGSVVSESAVRSHLHDLRQALGDGVIETVIGRGYRFSAPFEAGDEDVAPGPPVARAAAASPERVVVGRDRELATLRRALDRAATGHRQICVVSGEPGIGKTTLVDVFLDELEDRGVLAVRGQCVEQFGTPEAYLAMIEVIGKLCRAERGASILGAFMRYAPTLLARVPHLVPDELHADVSRRAQGGTDARTARELGEALEVVCAQDTLVLVVEDMQWSDIATIDLLALLGQRTERAQLMVIATARRTAVQTSEHPLGRVVRSLFARSGAAHVALERIDGASVRELVDRRFPGHRFPDPLIDVLARITGGTPLFLVTFIEDLVGRGMLAERDGSWSLTVSVEDIAAHRPDTIKQLIDIQLDRLSDDEQRVLGAASLVGATFSTGPVAAALRMPVEEVDDLCDGFARRVLFLRREASEDSPDGAQHSRYAVTHALVQEVLEERTPMARRQRWHLAIAEYLERTYAGRATEIARTLAAHFDKARMPARAIEHYVVAGHQTALRFAAQDAVALYERARELVARLPRTPERDALELKILAMIGQLLIRTPYRRGDPIHVYQRAIDLAREIGDHANQYLALANLCLRHVLHAEFALAVAVCDELVTVAAQTDLDPLLVEYGTNVRALTAVYRGELALAYAWFDALAGSTARSTPADGLIHHAALHGPIARSGLARSYVALIRCLLGEPDRAARDARDAIPAAADVDDPIRRGILENMRARIHFLRRDPPGEVEQAALAIVRRATAAPWALEESKILAQWAESHRAPLTAAAAAAVVDGFRTRLASASLGAPFSAAPIADMLQRSGYRAEAIDVIDRTIAYAIDHEELLCVPDLFRARGDLLAATDPAAAIAAYREAHARAAATQMTLFMMRAATQLAKLTAGAPMYREARAWVADAFGRCAEPTSETPDFVQARAVLASG